MKTILVCNQKGGVGKSLIADELAFALERAGADPGFADQDWVVAAAFVEYVDELIDFRVAFDHRIDAPGGGFGQKIAPVLRQHRKVDFVERKRRIARNFRRLLFRMPGLFGCPCLRTHRVRAAGRRLQRSFAGRRCGMRLFDDFIRRSFA